LKSVLADGGYFTVPLSFYIAWSSVSGELKYDSAVIEKDALANVLVDAFTDLPEDFDFVGGHGVAALQHCERYARASLSHRRPAFVSCENIYYRLQASHHGFV
jgi:hypothetical protein